MAVRRNYRINLRNYGNPPAIMVSQYDENYDLVFEVYDGVVPATGLNAYTVKLVGRQPGNDPALKYEFTGTVSGIANNILSFTIDTTMTGRAGKGTAEIVILDTTNDVKFASFNLPVYVEKAAVPDDAIDADVERAQEIADQVEELIDGATEGAEAWAVGQRGGVDVESTDPTYHNNAKYYAEQAQDIADSIGIDATLSVAGKAADAKKTGDEISSLKEDLNENVNIIGDKLFSETPTELRQSSEGYRLNAAGYRITDADYKLDRYRVFAGDYVKIVSDDRWQFQSTSDVTTSGTQYIIGGKHGAGTFYTTVPEGARYVVLSTPITGSGASVYKGVSRIDEIETGVGINEENLTVLRNDIEFIGDSVYTKGSLELRVSSAGYRINDDGYRVTDADYKLDRYRVFAGDYVKIVSDDRWQFQSTSDVTTSGTQYIIGGKHGAGAFFEIVPEGATYIVLSTPITESGASANKLTSNIDVLNAELNTVEADIENSRNDFSALLNAYTSQVSDVKYPGTPSEVTVGIDTSVPKFTSGNQHAVCIPIISGTTIRLTKPQTNYCLVCFTTVYPAANVPITHYTSKTGVENTNIVAESQENDHYLVIYTHTVTLDPSDCDISYSQVARGTVELLPQLDEHMVNLLKYRPVGKISKPYIALSCDDGTAALATYTLPRIQYWNNQYNTNIPLHMALFDNCDVFADDTYKALVVDMCENHNCSIGIHGDRPFGDYSSSTALYAYMKKQRDSIIANTGVTPTSVMYPHSSYNDKIMVMAGAFCGACGVANGSIDTPYTYKDDLGFQFYVGEKSNCYALYRLNIKDTRIGDVAGVHRIIDYAIAHNFVICPYFHDNDFTTHDDATNTFYRTMLDTFIQYGMEKGIEFINFGDIRYLT